MVNMNGLETVMVHFKVLSRHLRILSQDSRKLARNSTQVHPECSPRALLLSQVARFFFSWYPTVYHDAHNLFVSQRFVSVWSSLLRFKSLNNGT
jgi:hypothetical protein